VGFFFIIPNFVTSTACGIGDNILMQGCGSGSGLDPESEDFLDPDPYWESGSGSRGKKIKKFQCKNALFSYFCKKKFTNKKV
jgi:hypothetical protein